MAVKKKQKHADLSSEEIKALILKKARAHFAKVGYEGASLKSVAESVQVANSLINYHYKDKAGLFCACIELFAKDQIQRINRIIAGGVKTREEFVVRLEMFVEEMLISYCNDPEGFEIIQREVLSGNKVVLKLFEETLLVGFKNVCQFFENAQKHGFIRKELSPFILSALLFSSTCDTGRKDHLSKRFFNTTITDPDWRKKMSEHIVSLFVRGVVS